MKVTIETPKAASHVTGNEKMSLWECVINALRGQGISTKEIKEEILKELSDKK